jgi:hypothetical protein
MRGFQRFLPLLFVLFAAQGLLRALAHSAHHPSAGTIVLVLVIILVLAAGIRRTMRRSGGRPRNRDRGSGPS